MQITFTPEISARQQITKYPEVKFASSQKPLIPGFARVRQIESDLH